jgi:hypothetical protein
VWQTMEPMEPRRRRAEGAGAQGGARDPNPFIAGNWVRGADFYGRSDLLAAIMEGPRDALWVVGARRLGKTSLMKELEHRTQQSPQCPFVTLYWDLEGSGDARGLAEGLLASVEDGEAFRRAVDVSVEEIEGLTVTDMLSTLVRKTVRSGWRLLLLLDEGEEFLGIARKDTGTLLRMRRLFHKGPELRTVLTSTRRLGRIDDATDYATSPFLHSFVPPLYLTPLLPEEARPLIARGGFPPDECEVILQQTGAHPFLLQLIASRLYESGDLSAVLEQVLADEMVANFFAVDFQTLEKPEHQVLEEVARREVLTTKGLAQSLGMSVEGLLPILFALRTMGYLALEGDSYRIGNAFFCRWLRRTRMSAGAEAMA